MVQRKTIKALDLFAGVGGSSAGAIAAGVNVVAAIDCWNLAEQTYNDNFRDVAFLNSGCEDINISELKKTIGSIDLIIASPECTSHTCAKGKAPRSEESRETAFQVTRFARAFAPRWIAVENVVHMRSWDRYKDWISELKEMGYQVKEQVINAADHGVPQARRRLFVLCDLERMPPTIRTVFKKRKTAASIISGNGHFKFSPLQANHRAAATLAAL